MRILIDTHIFLWLALSPKKVMATHIDILENPQNNVYLSSISIAEMMIKKSLGNLDIDFDILEVVNMMDIEVLDFDAKSALVLGSLPFYHKDPFDRMLISQAKTHKLKIITVDNKFKMYDCELI